jgi:hypothetical protein
VRRDERDVEYAEPNWIRHTDAVDSRLWAFYNPGGLNMRYNEPGAARDGTLIPASYASVLGADEDNISGTARMAPTSRSARSTPVWTSRIRSSPAA